MNNKKDRIIYPDRPKGRWDSSPSRRRKSRSRSPSRRTGDRGGDRERQQQHPHQSSSSSFRGRRKEHRNRRAEQEEDERLDALQNWGKAADPVRGREGEEGKEEEEKTVTSIPNFQLSGKLREETNSVNGVQLKYSEPHEARTPRQRWRLYPFKDTTPLEPIALHRKVLFLFLFLSPLLSSPSLATIILSAFLPFIKSLFTC
jgi:smad nuclear-interacting protein 1